MAVTINGSGPVTGVTTLASPTTINGLTLPSDSLQPGMVLVTPTSVAGTGVTLSGAVVTLSATGSASVNGCFTSTYANYYLVFSAIAGSASGSLFALRLRASGTDDSSSNYAYGQNYALYSGSGGAAGATAGTSFANFMSKTNAKKGGVVTTLTSPQLAETTGYFMQSIRYDASDTQAGAHNVNSAFDGFTILTTNTTTISGTIRIYGLRNS
jgi:hypothetical protein